LALEELADLVPGPGQVVVDVKAAGVNFPDLLTVQGKYQVRPPLPFTPGNEFAGVVRALGDGVASFAVGQRVIGFTRTGAFAQQALAPAEALMPMPDAMDFDTAAAITLTYGTAAPCARAKRCWCWARPAAWAWPQSKSARRWARA
jgi:NADPH2:quinone reductase